MNNSFEDPYKIGTPSNNFDNNGNRTSKPNTPTVEACDLKVRTPTVFSDNGLDKPSQRLNHYEKRRKSPVLRGSSKASLHLEADASQTSFSFAVSPSQKPLFV